MEMNDIGNFCKPSPLLSIVLYFTICIFYAEGK